MDEKQVGIIGKYRVERVSDPTGKHNDCRVFVLDPRHDPLAGPVLFAYADAARAAGYEALATDLLNWLAELAVEAYYDDLEGNDHG